jgi:hypothetical protein
MTDIITLKTSIFNRIITALTPIVGADHIFLANEYAEPRSTAPHVVVRLYETYREQYSTGGIGNRRFCTKGKISIQIYDMLNKGTAKTDQIQQALRDSLESTTSGQYVLDTVVLVFQETLDKYMHTVLQCAYRDYEIK